MSAVLPPPAEQRGSPSAIQAVPSGPGGTAPPADVIFEGRRVAIPVDGLAIGREDDNDIVVSTPLASREHARIASGDGRHFVADLGSANGTLLNGERLRRESRWLNSGDTVSVGGEALRYVAGTTTGFGESPQAVSAPLTVRLDGATLGIGRDPANDLVLDDPNVSRFHAEVSAAGAEAELRDLGSRNGTRVDGKPAGRTRLQAGSEIRIGAYRLIFDGTGLLRRDDHGAMRMRAEGLTVEAGGKVILNRAAISLDPGELVLVIGESGSGKSTMIKALAGATGATEGAVTVNGEPVASRLTDIGYVPQDDIVHPHLTVAEALRYAARLRLPRDSTAEEIEDAVDRVLEELSLAEHAETRIGSLSGGQRSEPGWGSSCSTGPACSI